MKFPMMNYFLIYHENWTFYRVALYYVDKQIFLVTNCRKAYSVVVNMNR